MAKTLASRLSLDEVRTSAQRAQAEGRKLVTRLRKDATAFLNRRPVDVLDDVRKRATATAKEIEARRRRLNGLVLTPLGRLADEIAARSGLARAHDLADLKRRVEELERRITRASKAA